ncbi:M23 family metallopeptidase [Enterococcus sp.]|uniref:M23 family metallopeptidase n=1 Tax=Enterococcus sp. TaxID=35783 RepID=UPI00289BCA3E|nr:M23 family metallopeptidase [Enterococcus sp.]
MKEKELRLKSSVKDKVEAILPFTDEWFVTATPAKKIPSHGTTLFGVTYAYDFIQIDQKGLSSNRISWDTFFSTENPNDFYCFGRPVIAPVSGKIVAVHNNASDDVVRRSLPSGVPYMLNQAKRVAKGPVEIAGNYVVIQDDESHYFVVIVHLKQHSITCRPGNYIEAGTEIGKCGNSGNSIQPHIHIQAMDKNDFHLAKGIPLYFTDYLEKRSFCHQEKLVSSGMPDHSTRIKPLIT